MIDRQYPRVHAKERCDVCWLPPGGFFKVRGRRQTSDEYPVRSVSRQGSHLKGLEWLAISHCPGPNLTATIPQEGVICVIHHSGLRLAEPELKVWRQSTEATGSSAQQHKPWSCSPWVCASWWCWTSRTGPRCRSGCCWSCPAGTGWGRATLGRFGCLLGAWASARVLWQMDRGEVWGSVVAAGVISKKVPDDAKFHI